MSELIKLLLKAVRGLSQDDQDKVIAELEGPCAKAQDVYDEITDHGRKAKPTSEEAENCPLVRP